MKTISAKMIINEIEEFGECYIGNEQILGYEYIERQIKRLKKYAKENCTKNIWFRKDDDEWYAVFEF